MINHLEQEIAELVLQRVEIVARDRVGDLVGFLDGVGRDGREALLDVPRTAGVLVAQARHDGEQIVERVALLPGAFPPRQPWHVADGGGGATVQRGERKFVAEYPKG